MGTVGNINIAMTVTDGGMAKGLKAGQERLWQFKASLDQAGRSTGGLALAGAAAGTAFAAVSAGAHLAGRGVGLAAEGFGKAVTAASDLAETQSAVRETFGRAAPAVEAFAGQLADRLGVAKNAAMQGSIAFGMMAQSAGLSAGASAKLGNEFAALAIDAGSFYNVPVDDALLRIRSGLSGESEPLRRFGIFLNEASVKNEAFRLGIARTGDELTDQQKILARFSLIRQGMDAKRATGDASKTAGSVGNRMKAIGGSVENLFADIGAAVEPITQRVLQLVSGLVEAFARYFGDSAGDVKSWAASVGQAGGAVDQAFRATGYVVGEVLNQLNNLRLAFDVGGYVGATAAGILAEAFGSTLGIFQDVVRALTGMDLGLGKIADTAKGVGAKLQSVGMGLYRDAGAAGQADPRAVVGRVFGQAQAGAGQSGGKGVQAERVDLGAAGGPLAAAGQAARLSGDLDKLRAKWTADAQAAGVASRAAEVYAFAAKGASAAQVAEAASLARLADRREATAAAMKQYGDIQRDILAIGRDPGWAAAADAMRKGADPRAVAGLRAMTNQYEMLKKAVDRWKDAQSDAASLFESTRSPYEKMAMEAAKAQDLFKKGLIDQSTLDRAMLAAGKGFVGDKGANPAAAEKGGKEAFSAILDFRNQGRNDNTAADIARKSLSVGERQLQALEVMRDRIADPTAVPAGLTVKLPN